MSRSRWLDHLALAALTCFSTFLLVGNFDVRLANAVSDDGVVRYAWFFRYPELFAHDAATLNWGPVALASMMNWLPAAAFKYLDVPPELFYWLFTFLQNVLLALAVYRFTTVASGSREAAWLAALFTLAFRPQWWNIGVFADADWCPYAAWMALPLFVYAAAFALERRALAAALTLLVGGLVHPLLGLFSGTMLGAYALLLWLRDRDSRSLVIRIAGLAAVAVLFTLPALVAKAGMQEAPLEQILPMVLRNGHTVPWDSTICSFCARFFLRGLAITLPIAALALLAAGEAGNHRDLRLFLAACTAATVALCLAHVFAWFTHNAALMRIITLRSTIVLLALAMPVVVAFLWRRFISGPPAAGLIAGFAIVLPSAATLLAALLALGPGALRPGAPRKGAARVCEILGMALCVVQPLRYLTRAGREPVPRFDLYLLEPLMGRDYVALFFGYQAWQFPHEARFAAIVLCALAFWRWRAGRRARESPPGAAVAPRSPLPYAALLAAALIVYLLMWNNQSGRNAVIGEARSYYEVQAWARSATPASAEFIVGNTSVYEGWRNFTHRPQVASAPVCAVYLCTLPALAHDRKIGEFYARVGKDSYMDLDAAGLKALAREFGGDYAVRRKSWKALALPVAYENAQYMVYRVR